MSYLKAGYYQAGYYEADYYGNVVVDPDAPVATSVNVTPGSASLFVGNIAELSAVVYDQYGSGMPGASVSWGSSVTGVATVDTNGNVTAVSPGTTVITATSGGASDTAVIIVLEASYGRGPLTLLIRRGGRIIPTITTVVQMGSTALLMGNTSIRWGYN